MTKINYDNIYKKLKKDNNIKFDLVKEAIHHVKETKCTDGLPDKYLPIIDTFLAEMMDYLERGGLLCSKDRNIVIMQNCRQAPDVMMRFINEKHGAYSVLMNTLQHPYLDDEDDYLVFTQDYGFFTLCSYDISEYLHNEYFYPLFENLFSLGKLKEVYEINRINFHYIGSYHIKNNITRNEVKTVINFENSIVELDSETQQDKREEFLDKITTHNRCDRCDFYKNIKKPYIDEMKQLLENGEILTTKDKSVLIGLNNKKTLDKIIEKVGDYQILFESMITGGFYIGEIKENQYLVYVDESMFTLDDDIFNALSDSIVFPVIDNTFFD